MTDGFEKICKYVEFDNMTLLDGSNLLVLNNKVNGNNIGNIRYINQHPNGIPKTNKNLIQPMGYSVPNFLVSDPVWSK